MTWSLCCGTFRRRRSPPWLTSCLQKVCARASRLAARRSSSGSVSHSFPSRIYRSAQECPDNGQCKACPRIIEGEMSARFDHAGKAQSGLPTRRVWRAVPPTSVPCLPLAGAFPGRPTPMPAEAQDARAVLRTAWRQPAEPPPFDGSTYPPNNPLRPHVRRCSPRRNSEAFAQDRV
jgi:hypothetical protein